MNFEEASSPRGWRVFGYVVAIMLCAMICQAADKPKAMSPEFHHTVFIGKPAAEVWVALTMKATVDRYYMAPLLALELKNGGRIAYGKDTALIEGTVTEVDAPKKLSHTFRFAGDTGSETLVTYEVEPVGDAMCVLHISHTGFKEDGQTLADITHGWPVIASSLKTLLETGHPLPWPKPEPKD